MAKKYILDPGHGGVDPGANGFGKKEKDWNLKISLYQFKRLQELGVNVSITRTGDQSIESAQRGYSIKDKYDVCISNHFNAFDGSARGIETIHSIHANNKLATDLAKSLVSVTGLPLRRVFDREYNGDDYYFMHRLTGRTETIIVEYGFIDNKEDHAFYANEVNFFKAAEVVVKVICEHAGVKYEPVKTEKVEVSKKYHKVQVGAFSKKENAENLAKELKKDGYASYVVYE